ncbi:homing endonuclease [Aeromonas phage D9]|nr:homing endonuclease [Aeromonas phage D9]
MQYFPVWITEKHLVYPDGRVWSEARQIFLKPVISKSSGYWFIGNHVTKLVGGSGTVHRILCHCFKGGIPPGMVVDHKDGDKTNNALENLEVITHAENTKRAYEKGLAKGRPGETNSMAKLTADQAHQAFEMMVNGSDNETIASTFNIHPRYVSLMRHGKRWKAVYDKFTSIPRSNKPDGFKEKFLKYLEMKDTHTNREIAKTVNVDPSTISRWRSGETRQG